MSAPVSLTAGVHTLEVQFFEDFGGTSGVDLPLPNGVSYVSDSFSKSGTITATDGTVNLGGQFTSAGLGTFNRTGGAVNVTGTLDNTNATLTLDTTTGSWNLAGGTIKGGVIQNETTTGSGAPQLIATPSLATDLEGYWHLDGNGNDSSGNGRDLTLYGGVGFAPGLFGQALDLPKDNSEFAHAPKTTRPSISAPTTSPSKCGPTTTTRRASRC